MTSPRRTPATDPDNILIVWDDPALAAVLDPAPPKRQPRRAGTGLYVHPRDLDVDQDTPTGELTRRVTVR